MPKQEEYIPIYLFLGFLESGKTKFIQETLEDRRFNKGERTLFLMCEEGIEELDLSKMPKKNIEIRLIEDKSELTEENLNAIVAEYKPESTTECGTLTISLTQCPTVLRSRR